MAAAINCSRRAAWLTVNISPLTGQREHVLVSARQAAPTHYRPHPWPTEIVIYHNLVQRPAARLRSSRQWGADATAVNYKAEPSTGPRSSASSPLCRTSRRPLRRDQNFNELGLDIADYQSAEAVVDLLTEHGIPHGAPGACGDRAVITAARRARSSSRLNGT